MASNVSLLSHIEIILELLEHVASAKESPEKKLNGPDALDHLVSKQEAQRLKGKFPELLVQATKPLAAFWQIGKFLPTLLQ